VTTGVNLVCGHRARGGAREEVRASTSSGEVRAKK